MSAAACFFLSNRFYGEQERCEKKKRKPQWLDGKGSRRTIPTVDVQAISRLLHELLTGKLYCAFHNKNNGDN